MKEIWKDIKGYEGLYQVSNLGNVKRLKTIKIKGSGNYQRQEHFLKQRTINSGYRMVDLYKNNIREQLLVHRLIANTFIPNPNNYPCVNHKDENKKNNNLNNLEWCTYKYNTEYSNVIEKSNNATKKKVAQIDKNTLKIINVFESILEASRKTGIHDGNINECSKGKRNTAGGYKWKILG